MPGESFRIDFDASGALAALDRLTDSSNAAVRPAAQAGAQVLYDAARANAPISEAAHWFHGKSFKKTGQKYRFVPGSLKESIYQAFSTDKSGATKATYHVSWRHNAKDPSVPYGHMVEFGTSRAPAHPFLRKALSEDGTRAMQAAKARFLAELAEQTGGK